MGLTVDQIIDDILEKEGGYVDHSDDLGGATMYGITEAVARKAGFTGAMKSLPREVARNIYLQQYVIRPGFDQVAKLSPAVAAELTDTGVNVGPGQAGRFLQQALNVLNLDGQLFPDLVEDGQVGPASLDALRKYMARRGAEGETVLLKALNCLQGARYIEISRARPQNQSFTYGWLSQRVAL